MHVFILQRVIALVPLLLGVSLLVFLMTQLVPGDPVMMMLGEYSVASAEDIEKLRTQLGFNDPLHVQYGRYLSGLVQGIWAIPCARASPWPSSSCNACPGPSN